MTVLSPRALSVLRRMAELPEGDEDAEILVEGWQCYIGTDRIHRSTVNQLLYCTAIRKAYDEAPYFIINDTGRAIVRRPELADEVFETIMLRRGAFSIIDDQIVSLER